MKFRKMASVLLAASLLIGCAAAENRTIFKRMSEEESMANEALPVEERAESFSPGGAAFAEGPRGDSCAR